MDKNIYRKSQQDKLSSPEELNSYIKVTNPGVWIILISIIVLLIGVCVWGFFGKLETKLSTVCIVNDNATTCYVKDDNIPKISLDKRVYIEDKEYQITSISKDPISVSEEQFNEYALYVGDLTVGEWVYEVDLNANLVSGVYKAQIVVDSVSPFYFIFN